MARHYGIPYMGSKQKLVDKILPFILKRHKGVDSFYDLFSGGGSASLYVTLKYPHLDTYYSELSLAIGNLMLHLRDGEDIPFDFVPREQFMKEHLANDWWAGLLQTCWTFGNNQKSYLYGLDIQDFKEELSKLATTGEADIAYLEKFANEYSLKKHNKEINTKIFLNTNKYKTPYQRRIVLTRQIANIGRLQHMARLERLVQIQNMPGISTLHITAGRSYENIDIMGVRPIIYCDPPYENTAEYKEGGFDHKAFYDWAANNKHPVYISSYKVSDDRFKLVKAVNTRSLLNAAKQGKPEYNYENVYWNGVE